MNWPDQEKSDEVPPFLDNLNPPQMQAVLHTDGPVMIIAGAGSGKTRVLTFRIANIVHKGVDPFNILALTFTNKAAKEMRNRIEKLVGGNARNLWMGTFHSVFARILRQEAERIGYPSNFTIYDSDDSKSLIKAILKEMNIDDKMYKPNLVLGRISMAKNNLITAKDYFQNEELINQDKASNRGKFADIYLAYTTRCFKAGAMDFDDILVNTHMIFKHHADILNKWQHKFKYILVDEYQDTNHVQYMITKKLAAVTQNICVVGDDAQSIYAFRGANIQNILNFERDYPDVSTYKLEQNYRSTQIIVNAASSVIKNNKKQLDKKVWTANEEGDKIKVTRNASENDEGKRVAEYIFEDKQNEHLPNKAFAILYRTNAQSRAMEEALRRQGIDYRIYGGTSFYQRKEVKDLLSYLRFVINPNDEEALKRIINYPTRGIGDTSLNRLIYLSGQQNMGLWEVIKNIRSFPEIGNGGPKIENFGMMIQSFIGMTETTNAFDLATHVAKQTGLMRTLFEDKSVEGISRYENITELLNGIQEFVEDDESEKDKTLANFLEEVALYTDDQKDKDPDRDCISLMTIHASKGLEFPIVHLIGMEENLFPSQMALMNRQELEEERRLFYVAVTRAERKLYLSFATSRFKYGSLIPCEPSRFIDEIDAKYLDMSLASMKSKAVYQRNSDEEQFVSANKPTSNKSIFTTPKVAAPLPPEDPNFVAGDISHLKVGDMVQHQRFGRGVVAEIEGEGQNQKAKVNFDNIGTKVLVLKFAKMRIL
jgi:DNA helicase II / ATP-dependent DNA helicase PcrA